jgi:hypothetical protein
MRYEFYLTLQILLYIRVNLSLWATSFEWASAAGGLIFISSYRNRLVSLEFQEAWSAERAFIVTTLPPTSPHHGSCERLRHPFVAFCEPAATRKAYSSLQTS